MAIISATTKKAAEVGFIRTAAQSLTAAIPTSVIGMSLTGEWLQGILLGVLSAVVTALLAGASSALSIISKGIPDAYQTSTDVAVQDTVLPEPGDAATQADIDAEATPTDVGHTVTASLDEDAEETANDLSTDTETPDTAETK